MIVTCTPNPSLDRTIEIDTLRRGEVQRVGAVGVQPGGKGINVARALYRNGHDTLAVVPLGGAEGELFTALANSAGVPLSPVRLDAPVRVNVTLAEADGTTTKLNDNGAPLDPRARAKLLDATLRAATGARWVAGCGSLPPGAGDDFYAELVAGVRVTGARVAIDTSGPALQAAVRARPELIKPNHHELAELIGDDLKTFGDVVDAGRDVIARGVAAVLVSLGGDGALLITDAGVWFGESDAVNVRSTVGAGDAMLAGFLADGGRDATALARGVTWAAAAVGLSGSTMPGGEDMRPGLVRVFDEFEPDRVLKDA
jgi:1-phosphofructokinase